MMGKRGWRLTCLFALSLILFLSILAVWQEAGRWRAVDKWSLTSRYVGTTPNGRCCEQAQLVACNPCLTSPTCTAGSTSTGYCAAPGGSKTNTASCQPKFGLFCDATLFTPQNQNPTANVKKCFLTGETQACNGGTQCSIDGTKTQDTTTPYAGCNAQMDKCPSQPDPACTQNP